MADGLSETKQVLLATEAELYIEQLNTYTIKDIGSSKWMSQHEHTEKLNMQAIISASNHADEFIKELLITLNKVPVLIHELIAIEMWKKMVFSEIITSEYYPRSTLPVYFVLFHEATLISLLETVLYHKESCEAAGDSILDLTDYCHRKITYLIARQDEDYSEDDERDIEQNSSSVEELKKQERTIAFNVGVKALSILVYITDHLSSIPLSVTTRLLNIHNMPVVLVQLVESPPWVKKNKEGEIMKFVDGKWRHISQGHRLELTKSEGQVWLALFHLLMNEDCQRKYEFNSYNKEHILMLQGFLNEVLLDQIPSLLDLRRYLSQLAIMDPPAVKKDLLLQQVPEIQDTLLTENKDRWHMIAKFQRKAYFTPSELEIKKQAQMLADIYSPDVLENLIDDPPKCAMCGKYASKRCSRCQNEWYCKRECQVKHWSKHKPVCNVVE